MNSENSATRGLFKQQQWRVLLPFGLVLAMMVASLVLLGYGLAEGKGMLALALLALLGAVSWLYAQLLLPLARLEKSVSQVLEGEPEASLVGASSLLLKHLVTDINAMSEELTELYEDMDMRVARHTTRLAQKTAALKILYDVAASINQIPTLDDLLVRFLRMLKEMVSGKTASALLIGEDGEGQLVACIGLDNELVPAEALLPLDLCRCGKLLSPGDIVCEHDGAFCVREMGRTMYTPDTMRQISMPMEHQGKMLGEYRITIPNPGVSQREDIMEILESIGSHLGMAIAKQRSDEEALRLSIVEERNALAHELHDSLAQTLAGLRFQVSMLADSLDKQTRNEMANRDLDRLKNGIEEAHTELRALLASFRAPGTEHRGLVVSLERLLKRHGNETGIASYFQTDCEPGNLNSSEEIQILRIVQEALANSRKHSRAQTTRVLLNCLADGSFRVLIEDDGVGFEQHNREGHPGEHIGLSIMEERAKRLGGELRVESEPGEGTRVELCYKPAETMREPRRQWPV